MPSLSFILQYRKKSPVMRKLLLCALCAILCGACSVGHSVKVKQSQEGQTQETEIDTKGEIKNLSLVFQSYNGMPAPVAVAR
jgi:hypothetical protein